MKYQTLYLMVRVAVQSDHQNIVDTATEVEMQATFSLNDTSKVKILETEILLTRVRNIKNINHGTQH
jgi:hypothetical protein